MSENSVMLSVSEFDRLRALDVRVTLLQAELCATQSELADARRDTHPLTTRLHTPLASISSINPVTFLAGPYVRGVVCSNCEADMWLIGNDEKPMCGGCGLFVDSGVKMIAVTPR